LEAVLQQKIVECAWVANGEYMMMMMMMMMMMCTVSVDY
jgi:hypothetical protein